MCRKIVTSAMCGFRQQPQFLDVFRIHVAAKGRFGFETP